MTSSQVVLLLSFCFASAGQAATYTNIDFPGAVQTGTNGLNDSGQMVGTYDDSSGATHGFLLSGGTYTTIDYPGAIWTVAQGISGDGQIVGIYYTCASSYGCFHSFLWNNGAFTALPDVPGSYPGATNATAINSSGQIAGWYVDACFCKAHGFLLTGGVYTTIDNPGDYSSNVSGMNDSGQLVGEGEQAWSGATPYSFIWGGGVFTALSFPLPAGASSAIPSAINNTGDVAGYYFMGGQSFGFVFSSGVLTPIVDPLAANGYTWINGQGLNSARQLAGNYIDSANHSHGFLASPSTLKRLPTLRSHQNCEERECDTDQARAVRWEWERFVFVQLNGACGERHQLGAGIRELNDA